MEDDSWAQTLFTITPTEDGYLREINESTIISGLNETQLNLDTENIAHRESLMNITRDFIDPHELERSEYQEAECQTYMAGVPRVEYRISYRDEASQTLFIGKDYPRRTIATIQPPKDVLNVFNEKALPKFKKSELVQTIVTVMEDLSMNEILQGILQEITDEEQNDPELMVNATEDQLTEIEVSDVLNYVINRAKWIADPNPEAPIKTSSISTETSIKYNYHLKRVMIDFGTQTNMSLDARESSSKLLDDYLHLKDFARNLLEDSMGKSVYHRIIVDEIVDEIIGRCSEFIRPTLRNEAIQTIASGQPFNAKDDEMLKRLKSIVPPDPKESSEIVAPIIDTILGTVLTNVSKDARNVADFVVNRLFNRTSVIGDKLDSIRASSSGPPIDQVFAMRKLKLAAAMPKKREVEDASTQTDLAGVPQLRRFKLHKTVVCSVCPTQSECRWCHPENEPQKQEAILRTQDILLAYKPCYVVMDPAEATENMKRPCLPEIKALPVEADVSGDDESSSASSSYWEQYQEGIGQEKRKLAGSVSGWSHVVNTALTDAWLSKSPSRESKSTTSTKQSQTICRSSKSQIPLAKTTIEAMQILKSTFCNRETCPGLSSIIEDPKYMSSEISPTSSRNNGQLYVCANYKTPSSDECICELTNQLRDKTKILSVQMQIKTKR